MAVILQISAALIAAAAAAASVFLIRALHAAVKSLEQANQTMAELRKELAAVAKETVSALHAGRELSREMRVRLEQLDPLLSSTKHAGDAVRETSKAVKQISAAFSQTAGHVAESVSREQERISEAVGWAAAGIRLWQNWRESRQHHLPKR